jgi:hypothetical protein
MFLSQEYQPRLSVLKIISDNYATEFVMAKELLVDRLSKSVDLFSEWYWAGSENFFSR